MIFGDEGYLGVLRPLLEKLFQRMSATSFKVKLAIAELYQDRLYDLLHPARKRQIFKGRFFEEKNSTLTYVDVASPQV